jgi:hypothetical protein
MNIWLNGQLTDSVAADVNVDGWPSGEGVGYDQRWVPTLHFSSDSQK